jgi:hypothetical protein
MKDFTTSPDPPDSWSPSWSVPVGAVTIPFDTTIFNSYLPVIPQKKIDVSVPIQFEDYPVFNFDQEEFSLSGSLAFDFAGLNDDFSQIKLIEFKLKTENGFPTNVRTVLDVKDENSNTLFSLIEGENGFFGIPELDNNDITVEPAIALSKLSITDERIAQLEDAQYLDFELAISTQMIIDGILSADTVTFKRDYSLGIEVGLRVDLDINLK